MKNYFLNLFKKRKKEKPHENERNFKSTTLHEVFKNPFNVMSVEDFPCNKTNEGSESIKNKNAK